MREGEKGRQLRGTPSIGSRHFGLILQLKDSITKSYQKGMPKHSQNGGQNELKIVKNRLRRVSWERSVFECEKTSKK